MTLLIPLADPADRGAVADLFMRAADHVLLETGLPPGPEQVDDFFGGAPPGVDPAGSLRLGLRAQDGALDGITEVAFGYPDATDAYLGLLLLAPQARGRGQGSAMVQAVFRAARSRGAHRMLVAVLDANPRGVAFWRREGFAVERSLPGQQRGARTHLIHRMVRPL